MRAWNGLGTIRIAMVMFLFCALAGCSNGGTSAGSDAGTSAGSDAGTSAGPNCSDGIKNGTETDVDCGGPSCGGCAVTKVCAMDTDCASVACDANLCVVSPAVVSVAPPKGGVEGGTAITITGVGFVAGATVKINGVDAANVAVVSGTQITAKTPASATTGAVNVVVTNPSNRMATGIKLFTYVPISCSDGIKNGTETDVDCGGPSCGGCAVTKACAMDTDCASVACDANLCVVSPAVVSVAPLKGGVEGGTAITITGVGFVAGATVKINGVDAANVAVVSGTQITAKTPASATMGAVDVVVTNPSNRMATGIKLLSGRGWRRRCAPARPLPHHRTCGSASGGSES